MKKSFSSKERFKSFIPAFKGIKYAFIYEHNLRIHVFFAIFVVFLSLWLNLSAVEWSVLIVCIGMVFGAEIFNTALEQLVNFISPGYHEVAGRIKDLAAAAVLVFTLMAILTGMLILIPKLYQFCNHLR